MSIRMAQTEGLIPLRSVPSADRVNFKWLPREPIPILRVLDSTVTSPRRPSWGSLLNESGRGRLPDRQPRRPQSQTDSPGAWGRERIRVVDGCSQTAKRTAA